MLCTLGSKQRRETLKPQTLMKPPSSKRKSGDWMVELYPRVDHGHHHLPRGSVALLSGVCSGVVRENQKKLKSSQNPLNPQDP